MFAWNVNARAAERVMIHYIDAKADPSVREIQPIALEGDFDGHTFKTRCLMAHCYSAKATRTFRIDRIQDIAHSKTGEVLDLNEWLGALPMQGRPTTVDEGQLEHIEDVDRHTPLRWKLLLAVLVIGYVIGRFRLVRWALHAAGKKWGLWL